MSTEHTPDIEKYAEKIVNDLGLCITNKELVHLCTVLTTAIEEARKKGYDAGLADGTGNPLLAIENVRNDTERRVRAVLDDVDEYASHQDDDMEIQGMRRATQMVRGFLHLTNKDRE